MKINTKSVLDLPISPYDFAKSLQEIMAINGMVVPNDININLAQGEYHRFRSRDCKTRCCEYRVFERLLGAHIKCFRRGINIIWWYKDYHSLSHSDKLSQRNERLKLQKQREIDQRAAIERCIATLKRCTPAVDMHPYVKRKRIIPYAAFEDGALLCVPVTTIEGKLLSLQSIWTNGIKKFTANTSVRGGMRIIGSVTSDFYIVCEGWATGCSIYESTGITTVCAFNAGNIDPVCEAILKKYPNKQIVIAADNDDPGLKAALTAGQKHGLYIIYPDFAGIKSESNPEQVKLTDFNDLFVLSGIETVENQILEQLEKLSIQPTGIIENQPNTRGSLMKK